MIDALLEALATAPPADWLRLSRWGYAAVNTAHVLGIALLVGAILPLDLAMLGRPRDAPLGALSRVLLPFAIAGLVLAAGSGLWLFTTRAVEYAAQPLFLAKLGLIAIGVGNALLAHRVGVARRRPFAAVSVAAWLAALACGRLLAFV